MNLVSCAGCGVVLDKDILVFPEPYNEDGTIDEDVVIWYERDYHQKVPCPICQLSIIGDIV